MFETFFSTFTNSFAQPFANFGFDQPWAFALLPLPLLAWKFLPRAPQQQAALRVPFYRELAADISAQTHARLFSQRRFWLLSAIWLLLLLAAAAPRWIGDPVSLPASGRDLMLAVDVSGSMETPDMQIDSQLVQRVVAVKIVVDEFIKQRRGDRLGLMLFGGQAYMQAPLTFDRDTVRRFLREAQLGFAGDGTAIGDAIGLAAKRLRERPGNRHVLILITDGANNAGSVTPLEAAKVAADNHIVIYTVGIGADQRGLLSMLRGYSSDLDETTLQNIADTTGGRYFRARDPQELAKIYQLLDELEPVADKTQTYRPQQALFFWPLGLAFVLTLLWSLGHALSRAVSNTLNHSFNEKNTTRKTEAT